MPDPEPPPEPPEELAGPRYALGEQFSKGGMGGLWYARESATGRTIALKRILGRPDAESFRRFLNEARITARLEHPNIVPVHGLGTDPDGQPFYTMKLVQGTDLAGVLKKLAKGDPETIDRYPLAQLLIIFQKVCDAVAFAHSHHVIHRDLKPANIMLGPFGEVLVMDWGLAKDLGEPQASPASDAPSDADPSSDDPGATLPGQAFGSPHYMAPEQARGDIHLHDPRTDIYALGAVLYQILALRRPVSGTTAGAILARVIDGDLDPLLLPRLGTTPDEDADLPPELRRPKLPRLDLRHLPESVIPESLAAVVLRAMAFEPEKRYQSVPELQREITAYQNGFATGAERAGLGKQILLALRRNRREATVAGVLLAVLFIMAVASFIRIRSERDLAEQQRKETLVQTQKANRALAIADLNAATRASLEDQHEQSLVHVGRALRVDPTNPLALRRATSLLAERKWSELGKLTRKFEMIGCVAFSPDSSRLLVTDGTRLHCLETSSLQSSFSREPFEFSERIEGATFSGDGRLIAVVTGKQLHLLDGETLEQTALIEEAEAIQSVSFDETGQRIAVAQPSFVRLYDIDHSGALVERQQVEVGPMGRVALVGGEIACLTSLGVLVLVSTEQNQTVSDPRRPNARELAQYFLNPVGRIPIGSPGIGNPHRYYDSGFRADWSEGVGGEFLAALQGDLCFAISPDGTYVTKASGTKLVIHSSDPDKDDVDRSLAPIEHEGLILGAAFSPDSDLLVTTARDNSARVWNVRNRKLECDYLNHLDWVRFAAFSPDGQALVTMTREETGTLHVEALHLWKLPKYALGRSPCPRRNYYRSTKAFHPGKGGRPPIVAYVTPDKTVQVVNVLNGDPMFNSPPVRDGGDVFFCGNGKILAAEISADQRRELLVGWDVSTGSESYRLDLASSDECTFDAINNRFLIIRKDHRIEWRDATTGEALAAALLPYDGKLAAAGFRGGADEVCVAYHRERVMTVSRLNGKTFEQIGTSLQILPSITDTFSDHSVLYLDEKRVHIAIYTEGDSVMSSVVRIWDVLTGNSLSPAFHYDGRREIGGEFSKNGSCWITDDGSVFFFGSQEMKVFPMRNKILDRELSPDEQKVLFTVLGETEEDRTNNVESGREFGKVFDVQSGAEISHLGYLLRRNRFSNVWWDGWKFACAGTAVRTERGLFDVTTGVLVSDLSSGRESILDEDARFALIDSDDVASGNDSATQDDTAHSSTTILHIPKSPSRSPAWLPELLEALAGAAIDESGNVQALSDSPSVFQRVRDKVANAPEDDELTSLVRRMLNPASGTGGGVRFR